MDIYNITYKTCATHGISWMMARDEVDVESQDITGLYGLDVVLIILVLVPSAEIGVALVG